MTQGVKNGNEFGVVQGEHEEHEEGHENRLESQSDAMMPVKGIQAGIQEDRQSVRRRLVSRSRIGGRARGAVQCAALALIATLRDRRGQYYRCTVTVIF